MDYIVVIMICISGELTTRITFDREQQSLYNIPIAAVDGGGHTGYTLIRVNVADKGDNEPRFRMKNYRANVYDDTHVDSYVLQVSYQLTQLMSTSIYENFKNMCLDYAVCFIFILWTHSFRCRL